MIKIHDFNNAPLSKKNGLYGGVSGQKVGIQYMGDNWILKYPKYVKDMNRVDISYSTSPLSEYLGSHIYNILGYDVHETLLGERDGKIVVACRDFTDDNHVLMEFRTIKNYFNQELSEQLDRSMSSTGSDHFVDFEDLMLHLEYNPILQGIEGLEQRFWEQAVIDIYINNSDRNNGNWGILRNMKENVPDRLAPVFDNGGSFQDKLSKEKVDSILANKDLARKNASNTQTVYAVNGHILSVTNFLKLRNTYSGLQDALFYVVPLIQDKQNEIQKMFQEIPEEHQTKAGVMVPVFPKNMKTLFSLQLNSRLQDLLYPAYGNSIELINMACDEERTV